MPTPSTTSTLSVLVNQQERDQINADSSFTPSVVSSDRNDQRVAPVAQTPVTISVAGPLVAGSAATVTFAVTSGEAYAVRRVVLQNKSAVPLYVEVDGSTSATLGSFCLYPQTMQAWDVPLSSMSIYCPSGVTAPAINGSADLNLKLQGWL